jgi:hypothetical protein
LTGFNPRISTLRVVVKNPFSSPVIILYKEPFLLNLVSKDIAVSHLSSLFSGLSFAKIYNVFHRLKLALQNLKTAGK